jgi:hypothetical protein
MQGESFSPFSGMHRSVSRETNSFQAFTPEMTKILSEDFVSSVKEVGGVFRFGSGVLGKSAIALGFLILVIGVAVWRLHSDLAIIGAVLLAAVIFFLWFFPVLKFVSKHPDAALLDGAEWSGFQRFQATAKGVSPKALERVPTQLPGSQASLPGEKPLLFDGSDED